MTLDDALRNEHVAVLFRDDHLGLYKISVGSLLTVVSIRLTQDRANNVTRFQMSHTMKTPIQADAYRTSLALADSPAQALDKAITTLTMFYQEAIDAGHIPEEAWLHPW